jgi:2,4-dichlorophenol 6-monooxygenase
VSTEVPGVRRIDTEVLIVGAGGTGLTASVFLADLGVQTILVERHEGTSSLPKAHYLNQRTMEIFSLHGMADAVYAKSAPRANNAKIKWLTSVGGSGPLDRIVLAETDVMGGGDAAATYDAKGFSHPTHIPQFRLEPIIRENADQRSPGRVLFRHELRSFQQDSGGVIATVRDLDGDQDLEIRCKYLLGADGGRTVGPQLGVTMQGPTGMADFVSVWFSADLSSYFTDTDSVMRMIFPPGQVGQTCGLVAYGPTRWDGHSEEWGLGLMRGPDDPEKVDETSVVPIMREFLKIDVPLQVHNVTHWYLETTVADRFSVDRIHLLGDAAHKQTPNAGLGLNSAIQDAHNICWKLALVLKGTAPPGLLESYERERRPVLAENVEWSMFALTNHLLVVSAMGVNLAAPPEANEAAIAQLIADTRAGASRRARLAEVFRTQRIEYQAHDMEMGFNYPVGAVVDDGSPGPWRDPMGTDYRPTTRPGCRLPHVWLEYQGRRCSTHQLIPMGGMLALTSDTSAGQEWQDAVGKAAAKTGLPIRAVRIGPRGDALDPASKWIDVREVDSDGLVLVRPDGHVGFRAAKLPPNAADTIASVVGDILSAASMHDTHA